MNREEIKVGDLVEIVKNLHNQECPELNHLCGRYGEVEHVYKWIQTSYYLSGPEFEGITFFPGELRKIDSDISELTKVLEQTPELV